MSFWVDEESNCCLESTPCPYWSRPVMVLSGLGFLGMYLSSIITILYPPPPRQPPKSNSASKCATPFRSMARLDPYTRNGLVSRNGRRRCYRSLTSSTLLLVVSPQPKMCIPVYVRLTLRPHSSSIWVCVTWVLVVCDPSHGTFFSRCWTLFPNMPHAFRLFFLNPHLPLGRVGPYPSHKSNDTWRYRQTWCFSIVSYSFSTLAHAHKSHTI
ncbi:hypothetical protein QBC38DRAFT_194235 [Podospora fimiseda]|uniref:Uncharacterized protein n=1 Tax=Podospora fimiseda TaxID=252190 RepID=A0AAN7H2M2_9PEZI|nr:hypothetical protein QBC38DRAFT_194235 [Podospora fimiseda]